MLHYLRIRNLALMEETSLEFVRGFIAVTGETGAGKSVLLGALSLLSGARADKTLIRQGADVCEVEGALHLTDTTGVDAELARWSLPPCEDGVLVLSRSLARSKPARVTINGRIATLAMLQELGGTWIDFHGPGEPQKLYSEAAQLDFIDRYARNEAALLAWKQAYRAWQERLAEIESVRSAERLGNDEIDFIRGQIAAIDAVKPTPESIAALERDFARLSGAQELSEGCQQVRHGLRGDDGVAELLAGLLQKTRQLASVDEEIAPLARRIESMAIEANELAREFEDLADACDFDPRTAADLEARMDKWLSLQRKYGADIPRILEKRQQLASKIERQGDVEGTLLRLEGEAKKLRSALQPLGAELRRTREQAAAELAEKVSGLLVQLGFKKPRLRLEILSEEAPQAHGDSRCSFRFAPNAGQELLPLSKIASSGEAARVMLALKSVLARIDRTPVLVFDEVDANVGGEIARTVGRELAALGQGAQVFCVTHLPQVASLAQSHWVVRKDQTETETRVGIMPLHPDPDARLDELARMLGDRASATARTHALELLGG